MEVLTVDGAADRARPSWTRLWRMLGRLERGQAAIEYGGVLLVVSLVIAAVAAGFGATGLSGSLRSVIQHELCGVGIESFGGTCPGAGGAGARASRASADASAIRRALSNGRLVDACAGGPVADEVAAQAAPDSAACKQALAVLSPHQLSLLAVLAATIQSRQPGNGGNFAVLLDSYLSDPAYAVIALSSRAQLEQSRGNALLDRLHQSRGDLWDRLLGSLCGADGICLGGNKLSESYQEGFRASAAVGKISGAVLLATGIAGAVKELAVPGLRAALTRLGVGAADAEQAERAAQELEGAAASKQGAAATAVGGENSAAAVGRYVHSLAKANPERFYGPGSYTTEVSLFNDDGRLVGRADAIDYETQTVYELKPNNRGALAAGRRQVNRYAQLLSEQTGEGFTGRVVPYNPGEYQIPRGG